MSTNKPLPTPTGISAPYWNGLKEGRLTLPHCKSCGHWIFFPRRHCDKCWSQDLEWKEVKGAGTLYTYTLTRVPTLPDFADEMPQKLAVVELDEGVLFISDPLGFGGNDLAQGLAVKVAFIDCEDDAGPFKLPVFERP